MKKSQPTWTQVKAKLSAFDRPGLVALIQDLYAAHKENRTFLHTRFGLGEDVLEPYKQTIQRSISPDPGRSARILDISVAKGKQAIVDYRKAVGDPAGLAELTVFYCERAAGFVAILAMTMKATSKRCLICSSRLSLLRIPCLPAAATN